MLSARVPSGPQEEDAHPPSLRSSGADTFATVLDVLLAAVALTAPRVDDAHAAWSHDGRSIAFDRTYRVGGGSANASIVVASSDGRMLREITSTSAPFQAVRPVWSRSDEWVAFEVGSDLLPTTVQWERRDGRHANALFTGGGLFSTASPPSWSPDGRRLAVAGDLGGSAGVYVVARDTGRLRRVAGGPVRFAAWSPDGQRVAYADAVSLALASPGGGRPTRLPAPPAASPGRPMRAESPTRPAARSGSSRRMREARRLRVRPARRKSRRAHRPGPRMGAESPTAFAADPSAACSSCPRVERKEFRSPVLGTRRGRRTDA
jgi:hypothetical protein